MTYTYILKDEKLGIYKIGKTNKPAARFKSLCSLGKVFPIALLSKDIEKTLHKKFAANRCEHKDFKGNGGTEWFKRGGTFDTFIDSIDKGQRLPHISAFKMAEILADAGIIKVEDIRLMWDIKNSDYGLYFVGMAVLEAIKAIDAEYGSRVLKGYEKDIHIIDRKILISERLVNDLLDNHRLVLGTDRSKLSFTEGPCNIAELKKTKNNPLPSLYLAIKRVL